MTEPKKVRCEAIGRKVYPALASDDIDYCPNSKCRMPFVPIKKTTLPDGKVEFTIDYHKRRLNPFRPRGQRGASPTHNGKTRRERGRR
jgi:hypothetical protein